MKWSRSRTVKVFAVGATAALLLTACNGNDNNTPADDTTDTAAAEPVELSIAYWGDFGLTDLVPKYEAENPGVTIKLLEGEMNAQHEAQTSSSRWWSRPVSRAFCLANSAGNAIRSGRMGTWIRSSWRACRALRRCAWWPVRGRSSWLGGTHWSAGTRATTTGCATS